MEFFRTLIKKRPTIDSDMKDSAGRDSRDSQVSTISSPQWATSSKTFSAVSEEAPELTIMVPKEGMTYGTTWRLTWKRQLLVLRKKLKFKNMLPASSARAPV